MVFSKKVRDKKAEKKDKPEESMTPTEPNPVPKEEPKTTSGKLTFEAWAKFKGAEASAAGAQIRLKIDPKESMKESEFDGYIKKYRDS